MAVVNVHVWHSTDMVPKGMNVLWHRKHAIFNIPFNQRFCLTTVDIEVTDDGLASQELGVSLFKLKNPGTRS